MLTKYVLSKNFKIIKIFLVKFSIFTVEKIPCILHGHVFEMTKLVHDVSGFKHDLQECKTEYAQHLPRVHLDF